MKNIEDYFKLMRKLSTNTAYTQRELANEIDFSLGKINYCLNELKKKGLIKVKNFNKSKKKISYLYILTPSGITMKKNLTINFMKKKIKEYNELKREISEYEANFK